MGIAGRDQDSGNQWKLETWFPGLPFQRDRDFRARIQNHDQAMPLQKQMKKDLLKFHRFVDKNIWKVVHHTRRISIEAEIRGLRDDR